MAFLAHQQSLKAAKRSHLKERVANANQHRAEAKKKVVRINDVWKAEQAYQVWIKRCEGYSPEEIAEEFGLKAYEVSDLLWRTHEEHRKRLGEVIEVYREMEVTRSDMMLKRWMKIMLMDSIVVEKIEQGEPIARDSIEYPIKAAYICLEVMKFRCRLLGLYPADKVEEHQNPADLLAWLQTQVSVVKQVAEGTPKDLLVLETETNIDGNGSSQSH